MNGKRSLPSAIVDSSKPLQRQLHSIWLWLARLIYIVLFLSVLLAQVFMIYGYFQRTQIILSHASIDVSFEITKEKQFKVVRFSGENYTPGIEVGDVILRINETTLRPESTFEEVNTLLEGPPGEPVNITVQKDNGNVQEYTVIRWKPFVDPLKRLHIPTTLFFWFLFGVFSVLMLSTTAVSFFIFRVRTSDWFVTLLALSQLILPFTLNEVLDFFRNVSTSVSVTNPIIDSISNLTSTIAVIFGFILGPALLLFAIYLFPNGRFMPQKIIWIIPVFFFARPYALSQSGVSLFHILDPYSSWIWLALLISGVAIQIYRYQNMSSIIQRQQTKWAMVGFIGIISTLVISEIFWLFSSLWATDLIRKPNWELVFITFRNFIFFSIPLFVSSIALAISVYRYRLWDADFYINRALIYGAVTGILAFIWTVTIALIQYFFLAFTNQQSPLVAAILSSIQVVALFNPIRTRVENWVNQRFYKDRVNFVQAIVELQPEKWQYISSKDMLQILVSKTSQLIKNTNCAIYINTTKGLRLVSSFGFQKKENRQLNEEKSQYERLKKGQVVQLSNENTFILLVPLTVPRGHDNDLIGVLALGPRKDGSGYSRDHISDLNELGKSAGLAIHFLQLNENKKIASKEFT